MPSSFTMSAKGITVSDGNTTVEFTPEHRAFTSVTQKLMAFVGANSLPEEVWKEVLALGSAAEALKKWSGGGWIITASGKTILNGEQIDSSASKFILSRFKEGDTTWVAFANMLARLDKNPSFRSRQQFWKFVQNAGLPIDMEGYVYAYKGVTSNYLDCHSKRFDNTPGNGLAIRRNHVTDDPKVTCGVGFHAGTYVFSRGYGDKRVIVRLDPADVARVPNDSSEKIGLAAYVVVGDATDEPFNVPVWTPGNDQFCKNFTTFKGWPVYKIVRPPLKDGSKRLLPTRVPYTNEAAQASKGSLLTQDLVGLTLAEIVKRLLGYPLVEVAGALLESNPSKAVAVGTVADAEVAKVLSDIGFTFHQTVKEEETPIDPALFKAVPAVISTPAPDKKQAVSEKTPSVKGRVERVKAKLDKSPAPPSKASTSDKPWHGETLKELRQRIRHYEIPGASSLGAGQLRRMLDMLDGGYQTGRFKIGATAKENYDELKKLLS